MGATSAGSIQMDLEIKSDLDKDIQAESSKIADRIRKQVDAMSGDMFKNLRQSLVASLDKMNESIKATALNLKCRPSLSRWRAWSNKCLVHRCPISRLKAIRSQTQQPHRVLV